MGRQRMRQRRRQWMADTNDASTTSGPDERPHVHCYLTPRSRRRSALNLSTRARVCVYTRPRHPQRPFSPSSGASHPRVSGADGVELASATPPRPSTAPAARCQEEARAVR